MVNSARKYSTCLDVATALSLAVTDTSIRIGDTVTFTATVRVADLAGYERLRANFISERKVVLERRPPGSSSWTTVATMPASTLASGTYQLSASPSATYEWRGYFLKPADEGIRASSSAPFTVTVSGCLTPRCPQFPVQRTKEDAR
jgi:hypothetical protein